MANSPPPPTLTVQPRSALLVGANGLVGGHLLQLLLGDDAYNQVTVLVRKSLSFALAGSLRKYRAIHALTVANAMLSVAKQQNTGVAIYESERIQVLGRV